MADRKLQVFVSSTYLDLVEERQAAVEAILLAGHIPAGMELFSAGDDSQWATIKRWIDDSDVLLLILGERYGSLEPKSGLSYVQLEYDYASERIPTCALLLGEELIRKKYSLLGRDATDQHRQLHLEFKSRVQQKLCTVVEDLKDIKLEVFRALSPYASDDRLSGWVRGREHLENKALVSELQVTLRELRAKASTKPTVSEIWAEFHQHMDGLRTLKFPETVMVSSRLRYNFVGSALDLLHLDWKEVLDPSQRFAASKLLRHVLALLDVWGVGPTDTLGPLFRDFVVAEHEASSELFLKDEPKDGEL